MNNGKIIKEVSIKINGNGLCYDKIYDVNIHQIYQNTKVNKVNQVYIYVLFISVVKKGI